MYQKGRYIKRNPEYVFDFIVNHPFGTFVLAGERLLGTHIPVMVEGDADDFTLFAHVSNHFNEQFDYLEDGCEALLIFQGPHAYISSSWYEKKNVSTWDYSAVHVNVHLRIQTEKELENSLKKLVRHFEQGQEKPLYYEDIPEEIIKKQLPHITGFWCDPFHIEATAKLHQGYKKEDVESVIEHLGDMDDPSANLLGREIKAEHAEDQ